MVVLEGGGLINSNSNQYLQPDYLSPLPTTLDSKKSPLALLAQTCSQIGADTSNKPLLSTLDKKKTNHDSITRTSPKQTEKRSTPVEKLAFKPYETNVLSKRTDDRPLSKGDDEKKPSDRAPSTKSNSSLSTNDSSPSTESDKRSERNEKESSGASPIIRSGLEVLQGKDPLAMYKSMPPLNTLGLYGQGMDVHTNPAFRPPFGASSASFQHHAMMLAGLPSPSPYMTYTRIKTPGGGETVVPVCKDPYCTGCQFSMHNQLLSGGAPAQCPSGCTQCDHQKYGLAAMAMSSLAPSLPSSPYSQLGTPYICNWIVGENYCGKRFRTSEELLQHLRTHTSSESSHASNPLLNPLFASSLQRLGYPNGPLSPLSARYHPYAKPGSLPASLPGMPPYSAFGSAFNPYYSPYLYGQRIGPSAHP